MSDVVKDKAYFDKVYKDDLPSMIKDLKSKKVSHPDMRRTYGYSWKRLESHASAKHGSKFTTKHMLDIAHSHLNEEVEQLDEGMPASIIKHKQSISHLNDKEFAQKYSKEKYSDDQLRSMAWRHGLGGPGKPGHDTYVRRREKGLKEETEQLDELSKKTLGSYIKQATAKVHKSSFMAAKDKPENSAKHGMDAYKRIEGIRKATDRLTKEELELDEARRGRPRKDGTKPEGEEDGGREHIIMQLRKVVNLRGQKKVEFNDDSKHDIDVEHAKKALAKHDSMHRAADKQDYANKLAKSHASFKQTVSEAADPSTMRSDRGDVKPVTMIGADGRVKLFKHREPRKPIKIGQVPKYANEEVEIYEMDFEELDEALKGDQHKIDANKNNKIDSQDFKILKAKKHIKEALKGSQHKIDANKNKRIDAHDFELLRKKKDVKESSEQETLNKLYESLSEENREKFLRTLETDEGKEALLTFAREQGF